MPKENTHLFFAHELLEHLGDSDIFKLVSEHINQYYLGSIIPDTFYFSTKDSVNTISESLHGKDGNPTNTTIIKVLDNAKDMRDIAFILGFITHCALDIVFHPIVYRLSGNYYDEDPQKRQDAMYMHRHIETCLDHYLGNKMRIHTLITVQFLQGLLFEDILSHDFGVTQSDIRQALRRQLLLNRVFTSNTVYEILKFLHKKGIINDKKDLGLFYGEINTLESTPSDPLSSMDTIPNEGGRSSSKDLIITARQKALPMIEAAYAYSCKKITKEHLIEMIPGESLNTGKVENPKNIN